MIIIGKILIMIASLMFMFTFSEHNQYLIAAICLMILLYLMKTLYDEYKEFMDGSFNIESVTKSEIVSPLLLANKVNNSSVRLRTLHDYNYGSFNVYSNNENDIQYIEKNIKIASFKVRILDDDNNEVIIKREKKITLVGTDIKSENIFNEDTIKNTINSVIESRFNNKEQSDRLIKSIIGVEKDINTVTIKFKKDNLNPEDILPRVDISNSVKSILNDNSIIVVFLEE